MKSFFQKVEMFFISPSKRTNIEEYGKARLLMYAMIITTAFSTSYSTYYELTHSNIHIVKHIANIVGALTGPIGLVLLKLSGRIKFTLLIMLVVANALIFTSTYFSGGIYSVDLLWMVVITFVGFLFVGKNGGLILMFTALSYFILFFILDHNAVHDFRNYNVELGKNYILYNLFFLLGLASFITYFFVTGTAKVKKELDDLKEKQVRSLDYKYTHIMDNANEIIALHDNQNRVTYMSPAVKNILGIEAHEMLGSFYKEFLGGKIYNGEFKCIAKNGKEVWLEISYNPIKDEIGGGEVFISMARDITDKVLEIKKIALLRKQIANDFHDEMGNKLAAITLNSSILSMQIKEDPSIRDTIKKIEETSKSLYQHSRDFIWSIDSRSDDLKEIFSYLRDFGEDFFHSLPISFSVKSKAFSEQENITLPMYTGRHLILIFKEVLTNAAKHSQCKNIILSFYTDKENYFITVQDDGIGINENAKKGKGLISIKERAKSINSHLTIESNSFGTKIILQGKLPQLGEAQKQ